MRTVFLRVIDASDKPEELRNAIRQPVSALGRSRFEVDPREFAAVPGSPFAYRVPTRMLGLAARGRTLLALGAVARQGVGASTRFHRLGWEVSGRDIGAGKRYLWLAHGTRPQPFYKDSFFLVLWEGDGHEAKADVVTRYPYLNGNYGFKIQGEEVYGRPGLCYGKRTGNFTVQTMPPDHAFSFEGTAIHLAESHEGSTSFWPLLALLNSRSVAFWLNEVSAQHKTYSYVNSVPVPPDLEAALGPLAEQGWRCQFRLQTRDEVGNHFVLPALLRVEGNTLAGRAAAWREHEQRVSDELAATMAEIDDRCFEMYGIDATDRRAISEGFAANPNRPESSVENPRGDDEGEDDAEAEAVLGADSSTLASELVSWAIGVAFGRFDVRLATGARALPSEPEPFDALPVCAPAVLTGSDGLLLGTPAAGAVFPEDGVLVDDPGHPRDLTTAVRAVFETVFRARADAFWQEAAALIDPRDHDLRGWLAANFFEHHLKRHSKGRRKAPILWQLGTSARYSVWLYAPRLTRDSLFALTRDVVAPKLALEERRRASLVQDAGSNPTARQRSDIAAQEALVEELRVFNDEVRRVAPLWNPDLDDGVVLAMAPLWRLAPGHVAWQKVLKSHWDELVAGKHDWAHLAMRLWPERVVPRCATDRSLAIAHGLEAVFWVEGAEGKWLPRQKPTRSVEELVAERSSPAVKAALADLVATGANGPRGRRGRSTGVKA